MMLPYIVHQVVKGDIVLDQAFIVGVLYLHLLGNAGAYKGKRSVTPSSFLAYMAAHIRGLCTGNNFGSKLGKISFDI